MRYQDFTFECQYYVTEIPPKCRKPRPVLHTENITVPIRVATTAEARVACICSENERFSIDNVFRFFNEPKVSFLHFKGSFYRRLRDDVASEVDYLERYLRDIISVPRMSRKDAIKDAERWAKQFLIVDNDGELQVWGKTPEPCWVVDFEKDKVVARFTTQWQRYRVKFGAREFYSYVVPFVIAVSTLKRCSYVLPKSREELSSHFHVFEPKAFHQSLENEISADNDGVFFKVPDITESACVTLLNFISCVGKSEFETFTRMLVKERKLMVSLKCLEDNEVKDQFLATLYEECGIDVACLWMVLNHLYPSIMNR